MRDETFEVDHENRKIRIHVPAEVARAVDAGYGLVIDASRAAKVEIRALLEMPSEDPEV